MFFKEIFEAFKDIGKLSNQELEKGQRLEKNNKDNFVEVDANVFYKAVSRIRSNDIAKGDQAKGLDTLTIYSKNEYNKMNCYLGINNSSGYAIAHGDELVSVFSSQKSSGSAIVQDAKRNGATHLDCFATRTGGLNGKISGDLYSLYSRNGFKINKKLTTGTNPMVPYTIIKGISAFVNSKEQVELDNPSVVIFMVV